MSKIKVKSQGNQDGPQDVWVGVGGGGGVEDSRRGEKGCVCASECVRVCVCVCV